MDTLEQTVQGKRIRGPASRVAYFVLFLFGKGAGIAFSIAIVVVMEILDIRIAGMRALTLFLLTNLCIYAAVSVGAIVSTIRTRQPDRLCEAATEATLREPDSA